jgi:hypothetical protein
MALAIPSSPPPRSRGPFSSSASSRPRPAAASCRATPSSPMVTPGVRLTRHHHGHSRHSPPRHSPPRHSPPRRLSTSRTPSTLSTTGPLRRLCVQRPLRFYSLSLHSLTDHLLLALLILLLVSTPRTLAVINTTKPPQHDRTPSATLRTIPITLSTVSRFTASPISSSSCSSSSSSPPRGTLPSSTPPDLFYSIHHHHPAPGLVKNQS